MTKTSGNENFYHAVSLSGGKDSSALLLLMIEKGMPIDAVISADTGMEFPEMYNFELTGTPTHLNTRPTIAIGRDTQPCPVFQAA